MTDDNNNKKFKKKNYPASTVPTLKCPVVENYVGSIAVTR